MDVAIADLPGWLSFLLGFKYLFLFLATILEGMNSIVLAGFLASIGQLKVILIIPMLIVAHAINGYLWYGVGYWGGAGGRGGGGGGDEGKSAGSRRNGIDRREDSGGEDGALAKITRAVTGPTA